MRKIWLLMTKSANSRHVLILGATSAVAAPKWPVLLRRARDRLHLVGRNPGPSSPKSPGAALRPESPPKPPTSPELERNEACVGDALRALGQVDCVLIAHGDLGNQL